MLTSKVAIITGGAQGIGLATARLLLKNGAKVSLVDINEEVGQTASEELQKEFPQKHVMFLLADVSKQEELRRAFERTKEEFGSIDIVCNNAAISGEKNWRKVIDVNLIAVMEGTYLGVEYMSDKKGGRGGTIVNVSSRGGLQPMFFAPAYCAAKHGVVGFSRSMGTNTIKDSVKVNCICPGPTNTEIVRKGREDLDEDIKAQVNAKFANVELQKPEAVAEGILELITKDTAKSGCVMTVIHGEGRVYVHMPDADL